MIKQTPPMGWNTWNTFGENINEELIKSTAKKMIDLGLKDLGYEYVIIDDCWSLRERNERGELVADPVKFPSGMKALGDYLHNLGLKFGIYSCIGTYTCQRYPGSLDYEFIDAKTFASWGVDYLKYDCCYKSDTLPIETVYRRMSIALANCGRDILFNTCSWGTEHTAKWIDSIDAHAWRSTGDIMDNWKSICDLLSQQTEINGLGGFNCFNDMDMLVVGMNGVGNVGLGGCTTQEYETHFNIWSIMSSNLIIGCDLNNITPEALAILKNKEMIAINQDEACRQTYIARNWDDQKIFVKHLSNGDIAILMANFSEKNADNFTFNIEQLGLNRVTGKTLLVKDITSGKEWKIKNGVLDICSYSLKPHSCVVFRCKVVDL